MKPKEKAEKLFYDYLTYFPEFRNDLEYDYNVESAKNCALIAVDEVRWFHERLFYLTEGSLFDKYLDDVKQEIEKL